MILKFLINIGILVSFIIKIIENLSEAWSVYRETELLQQHVSILEKQLTRSKTNNTNENTQS